MSTHLHDFIMKVVFIFLTSVDIHRLCKPGIDFKGTECSMHHGHYLREAIKNREQWIHSSSQYHLQHINLKYPPCQLNCLALLLLVFYTPDFTPSVKGSGKITKEMIFPRPLTFTKYSHFQYCKQNIYSVKWKILFLQLLYSSLQNKYNTGMALLLPFVPEVVVPQYLLSHYKHKHQ